MKKARFLLVMIFWALLLHGASFGSQSDREKEQTSSLSDERSATNSSPDSSKDSQARGQKDEAGKYTDANQQSFAAAKKATPKRRPSTSQTKPASVRQQRLGTTLAGSNFQTETPGNAPDSRHTSSTISSEISNQPQKHAGMPVPGPTVAVNGQQFKNSRDPGARLATSGGLANSRRGTAVINGSDIKRKP
jgi:hypothetical protein